MNRILWLLATAAVLPAATLRVGAGRPLATPCQGIAEAAPGDTIEVEPGNYDGDVCAFSKPNLTVRGVGEQRPHLRAAGRASQGKAIWVLNPGAVNFTAENIEFSGATVPDRNGAGIRLDTGVGITVRNCYFHDNETGILAADAREQDVVVEYSIFENNGFGDGASHNIYVNHVRRFVFRGNYSTRSRIGHLVKTRAAENHILYNRLTQETGDGSFEIDISNGGRTFIVGNIIEQTSTAENENLVSYLGEGPDALNPSHELYVVNNTFVNRKFSGNFILTPASVLIPAIIRNNVFYGPGQLITQPAAILSDNFVGDPDFVDLAGYNFVLGPASPALDKAGDPGKAGTFSLVPEMQYRHPACLERRTAAGALDIGAYERNGSGTLADDVPARCASTSPPSTTPVEQPKPPAPAPSPVVNGASFLPDRVAPGSIASVFGAGFADRVVQASTVPLPRTVASVAVTLNALPAPIFFVSPGQINFQVPYEAEPGSSRLVITVGNDHQPVITFPIRPAAPGIFVQPGTSHAIAQNQDFSVNSSQRPAAPGSIVIVYMTGQGALRTPVATGAPASGTTLATAALPATATIGGVASEIQFLGMTPALIGVLQANLKVPEVDAGERPVVVTIGGTESNAAMLSVGPGN
jgi:uncharacterized protein (TIGR03437 family)